MSAQGRGRAASWRAAVAAAALLGSGDAAAHTPITTKLLYNKEVVRILAANCLGCHRPGGIAPMSLATYEEARPWAKAIKEELLERRMPPWPAVRGYGEFSNAPRLSQRDVDAIVNWVEGGAPKGAAELLPSAPLLPDDWPRGRPDLVLTADDAREVAPEADERVELLLATRIPGERWLAAADLRPGAPSVVHCAVLYLDGPRPRLLGTWVPGSRAAALPDGVAHRLPEGARLRVRLHYKGSAQPAADRSSVGLYFNAASARPRELRELELVPSASPEQGAPLFGSLRPREDLVAVAIVPRSDPQLASVQAAVHRPDGTSEVLVWTREPRDDWQPTYVFKRPVPLPRGSRLEAIAYLRAPQAAGALPAGPLVTLLAAKPAAGR